MEISEQIGNFVNAAKWTQTVSVIELMTEAKTYIEKLEQDRKVLRWALFQCREAIGGGTPFYSQTLMSIIDTAKNMTEPANDR